MTIRQATVADKEQILRLMYEFDDYYQNNSLFSSAYKPFLEYKNRDSTFQEVVNGFLTQSKYLFFVAEEESIILGYVCGVIEQRMYRVLQAEGCIGEWFVTATKRGKGIGKQLYDTLLKEFRKAQCDHIALTVYAANSEMITNYHRMGFLDSELTLVKKINPNDSDTQ